MNARPAYFSERFSIKDLELFSGIKAHTIRAWERRHGLLKPSRSDTNIRSYGMDDLRTILNTSLLLKGGMSISQVAVLTDGQRSEKVKAGINDQWGADGAMNALKMATVAFDEELFERTSRNYRGMHGFEALVEVLYLPLLNMIGLLWQSSSICAAQEHFSSNLVRQKLVSAIDALPLGGEDGRPPVVLYLPENEIHELGLLYLHFRLRKEGRRGIYLGESVPMEDIINLARHWPGALDICSILTVFPHVDHVKDYLTALDARLKGPAIRIHLCGPGLRGIAPKDLPARITVHANIPAMLHVVNSAGT